jgi:Asp/Glu/hydantoin racemase
MSTIGFLHTSAVHTERFAALVQAHAVGTHTVTVVDEALLHDAREKGPDHPSVRSRVHATLARLEEAGADVVVCTCSTIADVAERLGAERAVRVIRIDRPMMEAAVGAGPRIVVVVALESTVGPTRDLIEAVATERGEQVEISMVMSDGAWDRFEAGDLDGYLRSIADTCTAVNGDADVIVLAQASMADAVGLIATTTPVLASPHLAVAAALTAADRYPPGTVDP